MAYRDGIALPFKFAIDTGLHGLPAMHLNQSRGLPKKAAPRFKWQGQTARCRWELQEDGFRGAMSPETRAPVLFLVITLGYCICLISQAREAINDLPDSEEAVLSGHLPTCGVTVHLCNRGSGLQV